jgi:protein-tyrosine phosphatase
VIDLHCHILPGLDDGAPDLDASLAMARAAAAGGTRTMVATPHADGRWRVRAPERDAALATLRGALVREGIELTVLAGAEISLDFLLDLDDEERDSLRLGGGPYLLLECPLAQAAGAFDQYLARLLSSGERVVLAHPERCPTFHRDPERLTRLVHAGALTSVTAGAFAGRFGSTVQRFALDMVRNGLAHSVASDSHDDVNRPPGLRDELEEVGLGSMAAWLTEEVPGAILSGAPVPAAPPAPELPARRRGLRGLLGR